MNNTDFENKTVEQLHDIRCMLDAAMVNAMRAKDNDHADGRKINNVLNYLDDMRRKGLIFDFHVQVERAEENRPEDEASCPVRVDASLYNTHVQDEFVKDWGKDECCSDFETCDTCPAHSTESCIELKARDLDAGDFREAVNICKVDSNSCETCPYDNDFKSCKSVQECLGKEKPWD